MVVLCLLSTSKLNAMSSIQAAQGKVVVTPSLRIFVKYIQRDTPLFPQVFILVAEKADSEPVLFVVKLPDLLQFALTAQEELLLDSH